MKGPYRPCFEKECILELTWTMCGPKENLPFMAPSNYFPKRKMLCTDAVRLSQSRTVRSYLGLQLLEAWMACSSALGAVLFGLQACFHVGM